MRAYKRIQGANILPSGFGGGGGKLDVATVYLGGRIRSENKREGNTDETYSLSFLVVRSSGSLPRRPMRTSFARSYDRAGVEENV